MDNETIATITTNAAMETLATNTTTGTTFTTTLLPSASSPNQQQQQPPWSSGFQQEQQQWLWIQGFQCFVVLIGLPLLWIYLQRRKSSGCGVGGGSSFCCSNNNNNNNKTSTLSPSSSFHKQHVRRSSSNLLTRQSSTTTSSTNSTHSIDDDNEEEEDDIETGLQKPLLSPSSSLSLSSEQQQQQQDRSLSVVPKRSSFNKKKEREQHQNQGKRTSLTSFQEPERKSSEKSVRFQILEQEELETTTNTSSSTSTDNDNDDDGYEATSPLISAITGVEDIDERTHHRCNGGRNRAKNPAIEKEHDNERLRREIRSFKEQIEQLQAMVLQTKEKIEHEKKKKSKKKKTKGTNAATGSGGNSTTSSGDDEKKRKSKKTTTETSTGSTSAISASTSAAVADSRRVVSCPSVATDAAVFLGGDSDHTSMTSSSCSSKSTSFCSLATDAAVIAGYSESSSRVSLRLRRLQNQKRKVAILPGSSSSTSHGIHHRSRAHHRQITIPRANNTNSTALYSSTSQSQRPAPIAYQTRPGWVDLESFDWCKQFKTTSPNTPLHYPTKLHDTTPPSPPLPPPSPSTTTSKVSERIKRAAILRLKRDLIQCQNGSIYGTAAAPMRKYDDDDLCPTFWESSPLPSSSSSSSPANPSTHHNSDYFDETKYDMFQWQAMILGPKGTVWEGGRFGLILTFSHDYPYHAPISAKFVSPVIPPHPNVCPRTGEVYMNILGKRASGWSPAWCVSAVLMSIQSLLGNPTTEPVVANRAMKDLYETHRSEYLRQITDLVRESQEILFPRHLEQMIGYEM